MKTRIFDYATLEARALHFNCPGNFIRKLMDEPITPRSPSSSSSNFELRQKYFCANIHLVI